MSRHLRILRAGKLVEESHPENDARQRIYRLRPEPFDDLQSWLRQILQSGIGQLDAFKVYDEGEPPSP